VLFNGISYFCKVEDKRLAKIKNVLGTVDITEKDSELKSPMPGLVSEIRIKEGDSVKSGQGIIVIEAMKMENELRAQHDGIIKFVHVQEKQSVDQDQLLVEFE